MTKNEIIGFPYKKLNFPSFEIIGFTKIVKSGGEAYDEIRNSEKWELLKEMNVKEKSIFGIASMDKECPKDFYRYTMGIKKDDGYICNEQFKKELYSFIVKESEWIIFSLNFSNEYGKLWRNDPYKIIKDLGYNFNNNVGIHIDVFDENYDGNEMEFWMPIKIG